MIARIRSAWNQNQGAPGTSLIRFTIKRDGSITDATIFKPSGTTTLDTAALRAVAGDPDAAAAARRLSESDADHAPEFRIPMTKSILPGALAIALLAAWPHAQQPTQPPAPQQPTELEATHHRRRRRRAAPRRPRLHRAVDRRRDRRDREDDRPGAVGRSELRARVRVHPARHLRARSRGHVVHRRAVRPLARAERRRPDHRHGAEGRAPASASRCGCSTCAPGSRSYPRAVQTDRERAPLRAHDLGRDPQVAARAERRRAHEADLRLRSRRRADDRHGPEPQHQGDLHLRLRRREPAARHRRPDAEHHAALVARRPLDRLHVVPPRRREHLHLEHLRRARSTRSPRATRSARTGCPPGRPTARGSPSARRATATRRSTS